VLANLAGDEVGIGDLDRVKVPAGGGTTWTVQGIDGEKQVKFLEGIIVHVARRRAYWESANPTGEQPDCSSTDCITGVGDPGGPCMSCPLNQFGTAVKQGGGSGSGRGKACKESTLLFLLRPGANLPEVVVVPPGSLKPVKQYRLKLTLPYFSAITRLELEKVSNKDGIAYARIKPTLVGQLPPDSAAQVRNFAQALTGIFNSAGVDRHELEGTEEE
jgi:hypothetical protein